MKKTPILITPKEAVSLVKYSPVTNLKICRQIESLHFVKMKPINESMIEDISTNAASYCVLLLTIFNAGRIQGIREERKNKRK